MDVIITILVWIGIFLAYFSVEFVINLFFTYKIKNVSESDYKMAGIAGSISTFLFMFSTLLAATLGQSAFVSNHFFGSTILFLFWTTTAYSLGNYFATISIPHIERKIKDKFKKNKNETLEEKNENEK